MNELDTMLTKEDIYHLLTGRVPLLLNRFLTQNFKKSGIPLTREQWSILAVLWEKDGCSQQVLADLTNRDKPSTTRLIDNLEKEKYVVRRPHATDRRQNLIYLTDKGRSVETALSEEVEKTISMATVGLTKEQINGIRASFEIIYKNIKQQM